MAPAGFEILPEDDEGPPLLLLCCPPAAAPAAAAAAVPTTVMLLEPPPSPVDPPRPMSSPSPDVAICCAPLMIRARAEEAWLSSRMGCKLERGGGRMKSVDE